VAEDSKRHERPDRLRREPADEGRPEAAHQLRHGRRLTRPSADTLSRQHTGTKVRIAAIGPQAARVNDVVDETEISGILASFRRRGGG
jgi:alkaline phosphatase